MAIMTTGTVKNGVVVPNVPRLRARVEIHALGGPLKITPELQEEFDDWERAGAGTVEMVERPAEEVELQPGEKLTLGPGLVSSVGARHWRITVQPAASARLSVRGHDAFLSGYAESDEGSHDGDSAG